MPAKERARKSYGVTLVRGPFVRAQPHQRAFADADELLENLSSFKRPRAADIFCGAGGLSLGLKAAGFDVIVGVDHDATALATYASLFPGLALERDLSRPEAVDEVAELLKACDVTLIAGGPPCQPFSRAGSSKIRSLVKAGTRETHDQRRDLWKAWLEIVLTVQPAAVMLENVPEMAIGGEMEIMRTLVAELEGEGYGVHTRILKAVEHGVPQFRQRLFLVALEQGGGFDWPKPVVPQVGVGEAIGDLPPVEGGWRPEEGANGFLAYVVPEVPHPFVKRARVGMTRKLAGRLYDHITRPVRDDDRIIFGQMNSKTRYSDLEKGPEKRYRDDIFDDKYKRLALDEPSRSITAHIAKDGYWYIHPTQLRTLTVREAARIQTFPDRVRFAGPPSAAFRQIGNAVPPLLAEKVGRQIMKASERPSHAGISTTDVSRTLAWWFLERDNLDVALLEATTAWQVIAAHLLQARSAAMTREVWTALVKHESPEATLGLADDLRQLAELVGRPDRADRVLTAAKWYVEADDPFETVETMAANPHVSRPIAQLATLVVGGMALGPILSTAPVLRVAARWSGKPVDKVDKGSTGRMVVARLVGGSIFDNASSDARFAQAALLELAHAVCKPNRPLCEACPLREHCASKPTAEPRPSGHSR